MHMGAYNHAPISYHGTLTNGFTKVYLVCIADKLKQIHGKQSPKQLVHTPTCSALLPLSFVPGILHPGHRIACTIRAPLPSPNKNKSRNGALHRTVSYKGVYILYRACVGLSFVVLVIRITLSVFVTSDSLCMQWRQKVKSTFSHEIR